MLVEKFAAQRLIDPLPSSPEYRGGGIVLKDADIYTGLLGEVKNARSVEALRLIEARYSLLYLKSISPVVLRAFSSLPTTWRVWDGKRVSAISGVNSSATHPVNAMLNYAYAVLAARYEIAASVKGLDISAGSLHAGEHRRALVFDLIEVDRIATTNAVIAMIRGRRWKRSDFRVGLNGVVFLEPHVARMVAAVALPGRGHVRDVVNAYCRWLSVHCSLDISSISKA